MITFTAYLLEKGEYEIAGETTYESDPGFDHLFREARILLMRGASKVKIESKEVTIICLPPHHKTSIGEFHLILGSPLPNVDNWGVIPTKQ